ncbi:MAG TPA: hypothetical protein VF644_19660 [Pyrinomonadaceae bacterium]|jgi:hypothetical protein
MNTESWTWTTFWAAVTALAGLIPAGVLVWQILKRLRRKQKPRLFLSMQMSEVSGEEYVKVRQEIMEHVYDLRKDYKVYFFNEFIQRIEDFDESAFDGNKYLNEIDECEFFIAVISDKVLSSIYFEAAYALARGKKSIYFVSSDKVMPLVMRKLSNNRPQVRAIKITSLPEIKDTIRSIINKSA